MTSPYATYATGARFTHQSQPIPGRETEMTPNSAGGVGFILDDWERLNRFLITGSLGGTYYTGEKALTAENAAVVIRCLQKDGLRTVEAAREINVNNRAPKVDQQLFTIALALKHGDAATKAAARAAASGMMRTGTHLLHFCAMLDSLGGWSRSKRRVVADWFAQDAGRLAYQALKYNGRDGWTQRDALRVAHPVAPTPVHAAVYNWICGRGASKHLPDVLRHYEAIKASDMPVESKGFASVAAGLPREAIPTEALASTAVLRALLPHMPIHALIRNLGSLTASGVLVNGSAEAAQAAAMLVDRETLRKSRVHPFAVLLAATVYRGGAGVRGGKTWTPVPAILSALEDAYDLAFDNVVPTNKRMLVAIDVSGSMNMACVGTPISAALAATAMAVTLARLEPYATVVQFDTAVRRIVPVTRRTGIASITEMSGGGTDLSAPIRWALGDSSEPIGRWTGQRTVTTSTSVKKQDFDAIVLMTDNETWAGIRHSTQAFDEYKHRVNAKAKLVCCAFAANHANVVDPKDPAQFGTAGLDANLPALVSDFIGR